MKILTLKEKVEVIKYWEENKKSVRKIAKCFSIEKSQVSDIYTYIKKFNSNATSTGTGIDEMTLKWFFAAQNKNTPDSGTTLKEKAIAVAGSLDVQALQNV
ncbi:CENP-B N-terminal DNA-binding domain [Popillia japonica]|uniref:CENP-B N-terminal DNA-binding domain n=1 Tax=Popillia japonica TaxID=7064 RepID=A0AAW1JCB1_POPJA